AEQADPIALAQILAGERSDGANREVERRLLLCCRLRERVEEEHDIGAALRQPIGDKQPSAASTRPPVDAPHALAGAKLAQLGELDPLPARRRRPTPTC